MKKLLIVALIISGLHMLARGTFAQTATNKINNTATIYATNSPVTLNGILNAQSNVFIMNAILSTDSLTNLVYTTAAFNHIIKIGNNIKNSAGSAFVGPGFFISNATTGAQAFINLSSVGALRINSTTNIIISSDNGGISLLGDVTGPTSMTSVTNNSIVYQASGITGFSGSVTNVGVGNTNVLAFSSGVLTNRFFIP